MTVHVHVTDPAELASQLPGSLRRGTRLEVTVTVPLVQVKRIDRSREVLRSNPTAVFLRVSPNLRIIGPLRLRNGEVWAAAFDGVALDDMLATARAAGCRLASVSPASDLVPVALRVGRWRRRPSLTWHPARRTPFASRRMRRVTVAFCVMMVMTSAACAAVAPTLRCARLVRTHAGDRARAERVLRETERARAELRRVSRQLSDIADFENTRRAAGSLIARLSDVMPDSSTVVTLRLDAAEGSFTVITPNAADVLGAVESAQGIWAPRVSGALTSEMIRGRRYQRATIRFRRRPARG